MERLPRVSVIIPARNEERTIAKTIGSVRNLDYPRDRVEIIVVDNGSLDATAAAAERAGATVAKHPGILVGAVRNRGAELSSGAILVFLDADVIVQPHYVREAVAALQDEGTGAVGGTCTVPEGSSWIQTAWVVERGHDVIETDSLPGASLVVRRSVFDEIGGFSETLAAGEDDDLSRRVVNAGYRVLSIRGCDVEHLGYPATLAGIFHRQVWHGSSQLESAESLWEPMLLLTHGFASGLAAIPLVLAVSQSVSAIGGVVIFLFLLSGVAAFAKERRSNRVILSRFIQRSILYFAFLSGRSIGLSRNYLRRIAGHVKLGAAH